MEEENVIQERLLNAYNPSRFLQDLYEYPQLIDVFKDFEDFKNAVKDAIRTSLPDCYANFTHLLLKSICLDIASKSGQTTFVKILLDQGTRSNIVNRTYNRAPIHFATEGGHVGTLKVLLAKSTNINLQDTEEYQTALHIAVYKDNENCARLLIMKGASANIPNREGLSAIHLAARNGQFNMVKLILKEHWQRLDLDNYWDQNNQTTREVIYHMNMSEEQLMELQLMIKYLVPTRNYFDPLYYLMVSDETNFLNMEIDGSFSSIIAELLEIATENDLRQAVTRILNWLERTELENISLREIVFAAAVIALQNGHHVILQKLLNFMPVITGKLIMDLCQELPSLPRQEPNTSSCIDNWLECMKVMLNQESVNIHRVKNEKGVGPLHYAVWSGYDEVVSLFLKQDCYIGHKNIITNISDDTLSRYLDDCVQLCLEEQVNGRENIIEFNYRCLMPDGYKEHRNSELEMFLYIAHNSRFKHLLKHPLLSSFVYLKWYENLQFFKYKKKPLDSIPVNIMYNCKSIMDDLNCTIAILNSSTHILNLILHIIIAIMCIFFIFREILQLVANVRFYVKEWMCILQIMLSSFIVVMHSGAGLEFVTLLSTWKLMIVISHISPRFATSIIIFRTVFYNFIQLFAPYMTFIVVFSMIFYVLYKDSGNIAFSHPIYAIIKTIFMLVGDFGIDNILFDSEYSIWSGLVLVIFVFLIVILLMNMLNALTVSNTAEILSKAELIELIYRIELIVHYENFICMINSVIIRFFPNVINTKFYINLVQRVFLFRSFLEDGKIKCRVYDIEHIHDDNCIINYEYFFIKKMDKDIIEQAKQIAFARSNLFHQK